MIFFCKINMNSIESRKNPRNHPQAPSPAGLQPPLPQQWLLKEVKSQRTDYEEPQKSSTGSITCWSSASTSTTVASEGGEVTEY